MLPQRLLLVLALCCLVPEARAGEDVHKPNSTERRDALFREKEKFPLVDVKMVDPHGAAPVWVKGVFNTNPVIFQKLRYSGFRFKVQRPSKDVDFVWALQAPDNLDGWFIEAEKGDFTGFCEYGPEVEALKGPKVVTQPLGANRFIDNGEYLIWFAFRDDQPAEVRFTFLFRTLEQIEEDEEMPPVLTEFHGHFSYESIGQAVGVMTFIGVGTTLNLDADSGQTVIVSVIKDSPADKAGLLPGDVIVSLDGHDVAGLTLEDVVARIKGEPNSTLTIVVHRPSTGMTISGPIKRRYITVIDTGA